MAPTHSPKSVKDLAWRWILQQGTAASVRPTSDFLALIAGLWMGVVVLEGNTVQQFDAYYPTFQPDAFWSYFATIPCCSRMCGVSPFGDAIILLTRVKVSTVLQFDELTLPITPTMCVCVCMFEWPGSLTHITDSSRSVQQQQQQQKQQQQQQQQQHQQLQLKHQLILSNCGICLLCEACSAADFK